VNGVHRTELRPRTFPLTTLSSPSRFPSATPANYPLTTLSVPARFEVEVEVEVEVPPRGIEPRLPA
jgi:hypothetical protein